MIEILLVEDEKIQRKNLSDFLKSLEHRISESDSVKNAKELLNKKSFDIIISDMKLKDGSGKDILDFINEKELKTFFIIITAYSSVEDSVYILKNGGYDYIQKPINLDDLQIKIEKIEKIIDVQNENMILKEREEFSEFVYESEKMKDVVESVKKIANSNANILIVGESGTGKEQIAKMIHSFSNRKDKLFVAVNCGALNENLLETELFGYEKGAFTGAYERRKGRFEIAHKGTIFLDEIGDVSLNMQVKLLRVLQEKEFERVGGNEKIKVDVRVISATNRNLLKLIEEKKFREDLYFRLNVISLKIPPLRERKEDIEKLAHFFLNKFSKENNKRFKSFSKKAFEKLLSYSYPGNVRELQNIIQRAVILGSGETVQEKDIVIEKIETNEKKIFISFEEMVSDFEKKIIIDALEKNNFSVKDTALYLKTSERVIRYKMKKYGINY
ncbi:MAG: sigma-54 dependent transcriptional regulator [bacterium]|nr:sigma-54 dependent transcriptional regulator [bacterium]